MCRVTKPCILCHPPPPPKGNPAVNDPLENAAPIKPYCCHVKTFRTYVLSFLKLGVFIINLHVVFRNKLSDSEGMRPQMLQNGHHSIFINIYTYMEINLFAGLRGYGL